ncbi:hypothetical protein [Actinoplanes sp. G11-F43]|uniref:hypothetical protein n=1 Tax=Actinoplanes sp. G11-F43 TaxID=3424130 RepID=UPI003D35114F
MWSPQRRIAVLTSLSVLAGTVVGLLTNIVTDRPGPAVAGGLAVAVVAAVVLAVLQARAGTPGPDADHVQLADRGRIADTHVDVGPGQAARTRQEARDGGSITGSSIVIRSHPEQSPPPSGPALPR